MKLIVAGGTFDLLHAGHKSFLTEILNQTDHLILGLTSDDYVSWNKLGNIDDYLARKKNLEEFFVSIGKSKNIEILEISDVYGPLLNPNLKPDAIALTDANKNSIEKINQKREVLGLSVLNSIIIPINLAEDGKEISSTRIRNGEIDRDGKLYFKKDWQGKNFVLPESLREELSKPFGQVLQTIPDDLDGSKIITVGDETTKLFNERNIGQFLSIVDFKINREKKFNSLQDLGFGHVLSAKTLNPQGEISSFLFEEIKKIFKQNKRSVILIEGEDDLAVLPSLIVAPLGFVIYYGQPNNGLVEVFVTEESKNRARGFLERFLIS